MKLKEVEERERDDSLCKRARVMQRDSRRTYIHSCVEGTTDTHGSELVNLAMYSHTCGDIDMLPQPGLDAI